MLKVLIEMSENIQVQLSNGRMMTLKDLVMDYERLLKKVPKDDNPIISKLKVGEWFRIDREIIAKKMEEIHYKCNEAGEAGQSLWKSFEESNKIADKNPDQYPNLMETYIFEHNWEYKTEQEMRNMCKELGDGMCDEIICDLELQMRICNGENINDLIRNFDELPCVRVIELRNGGTGYFGGGVDSKSYHLPAVLRKFNFDPFFKNQYHTPYAFRRNFN